MKKALTEAVAETAKGVKATERQKEMAKDAIWLLGTLQGLE